MTRIHKEIKCVSSLGKKNPTPSWSDEHTQPATLFFDMETVPVYRGEHYSELTLILADKHGRKVCVLLNRDGVEELAQFIEEFRKAEKGK